MVRYRKNIIALIFCIVAGLLSANIHATTEEDAETRLTVIHKMIRFLSSRLTTARSTQDTVQERLRETELSIGKLVAELRKLENKLKRQKDRLGKLRRRRNQQNKALLMQREDLARQIRISYAMGRQDYLKILLNHENPSALARTLTYYGYFNRARAKRIRTVLSHIRRIHALEAEIDREASALEGLKRTKVEAKNTMERRFRQRKETLAKLSLEINRDDQRLARYQQDKNRLEKLIRDLRSAARHAPNQQSFRRFKGRLRWPTAGSIRHRFGTKRSLGNLTWQGVWIAGKAGQSIHAVSHGRVVFADWLRGFGLLLIIDHGDGYMSLYGHNRSLYKKTGDLIASGDVIASVGNSGGNTDNGLYFEIRHQGSPQNPNHWCKKPSLAARNS
uniref:Septal ring factor EnvC, activator of murein hydrolases AmiA and AmiB n=1 Tax=Candidatus Kentrum sp. MB TaxID=2138164 RepID=A0A450XX32_9GAMM|nr:MAG: Septal ring factor EnvC, activator of murein hydrolases AmiA and AmiB [Candidatus Kentron sp. MB]VFK76437.1 MAG: Septal ring factor EnvC, activator of murein hydrolases AmiA and AmiB [Candidatus Kentron sp. MB]